LIEIEEYEMHLIDNEIAENTRKNYLNTLRQLDVFLKSNNLILEKSSLIKFKQFLRDYEYKPKKYYTMKTINQKLVSVNVYLNWFKEEGYIKEGLSVKLFKSQAVYHRESINESEYKKLLKNCHDDELKLFMLTIGNTGLRITEACALKASDLGQKIISVENKGKSRGIAIPPFLKKLLKKYVRENKIENEIFFKNQRTYRAKLKVLAGKAKVNKDKVYPHAFRHYFAKAFIDNGGDATMLQQLMGHKNILTTTIYTNLDDNELSIQFARIKNI